jgi:hypothetical protein
MTSLLCDVGSGNIELFATTHEPHLFLAVYTDHQKFVFEI